MRTLVVALSIFASLLASASASSPGAEKIPLSGWQRIDLEGVLSDRAHALLGAYAKDEPTVVQVSIELFPPSAPAKAPSNGSPAAAGTAGTAGAATADGEVFLGKLDLSAPMIDALHGAAPASPADAPSENERFFERIKSVSVSAYVPKALLDQKALLETQLKRIAQVAPKVKAIVSIEELVMPSAKAAADAKIEKEKQRSAEAWDLKRWLVEFKDAIGVTVGATILSLFLSLIGLLALGTYRKTEEKKIAVTEARNAIEASRTAERKEEESAAEQTASGPGGAEPQDTAPEGESGFDRFREILKTDVEQASLVVREWLQSPTSGGPREALCTLPQRIDPASLATLFTMLKLDERKVWRSLLAERTAGPAAAEFRMADSFISRKLVETMLIPSPIRDPELKNLIRGMTLPECVILMRSDVETAACLVSYLPTAVVSRVFALLPADAAAAITLRSLKLSETELHGSAAALKSKIATTKSSQPQSVSGPFLENVSELLRDVDLAKEPAIWNALLEVRAVDTILSAGSRVFPNHLVENLPASILKGALDRFTTARKAEFLFALEPAEREFYAEICGKAGSKLREMLDYELGQIGANEIRGAKVKKAALSIRREFLVVVRSIIAADDTAREASREVLQLWLKQNGISEQANQAA